MRQKDAKRDAKTSLPGRLAMCGRFTLTATPKRLRERFALSAEPAEVPARYNIAPTQAVLVIPNRTRRLLRPARWGLIPHWAADAASGNRMINARAETLAARPAFRGALERRRCIVPADGFYEWRRDGRRRTPFHVRPRDGEPFGLAGLWEVWRPADGDPVASCTIITVAPNAAMAELHDRMPAILAPDAYDAWLHPAPRHPDELLPLLVPCPSDWLEIYQVSEHVNSPDNEDPDCVRPISAHASSPVAGPGHGGGREGAGAHPGTPARDDAE